MEHGQIVLGNGSNDVLELVARAFLGTGALRGRTRSTRSRSIRSRRRRAARAASSCRRKDYGHDLDAMAAAIATTPTSSGSPIRTIRPAPSALGEALEAFLERVPRARLVVLDEAYNEYLPAGTQTPTRVQWLSAPSESRRHAHASPRPTASPGLRVGYALAHPAVADLMNRVRQPFNVNSIALAAATAALDDMEFVARSFAVNAAGHAPDRGGLRARSASSTSPRYGNFITVRVGERERRSISACCKRGVIVRPDRRRLRLPEHLRVTVGTAPENERFLAALARQPEGR